jgi:hypothetical protein
MSGTNSRAKSQALLYFASVDNCTQNVTNSVNRQNWVESSTVDMLLPNPAFPFNQTKRMLRLNVQNIFII